MIIICLLLKGVVREIFEGVRIWLGWFVLDCMREYVFGFNLGNLIK